MMTSVKLAGMTGLAVLLAACGGTGEEPAAVEDVAVPEAGETAAGEEPAAEPTEEVAAPEAAETAEAAPAPPAATPAAAAAPAVAAAPAMFAMCKACHSVEPGENGIGPTLAGTYKAKAGHVADFEYSEAMLASGLVWDEATLDAYLENPRKVVPGTKMSYAGLKDAAKRKEVVDYLKTL